MPDSADTDGSPRKTERTYSIIGSMGRTATLWLTDVLNCHRSAFFVHGFDFNPDRSAAWQAQGARIAEQAGRAAELVSLPDHHDRYFDILEKFGNYKVYGTIHSLFPVFRGPVRRDYARAFVIRHPVDRIFSFYDKQYVPHVRSFDGGRSTSSLGRFAKSKIEYIVSRSILYGFDLADPEAVHFVWAVFTTLFYDSLADKHCRGFRMEDLTSDFESLLQFFIYVTQLTPESDPGFIDRARACPPRDVTRGRTMGSRERFGQLPEWQKKFLRDELMSNRTVTEFDPLDSGPAAKYSTLYDLYEAYGYRIDLGRGG